MVYHPLATGFGGERLPLETQALSYKLKSVRLEKKRVCTKTYFVRHQQDSLLAFFPAIFVPSEARLATDCRTIVRRTGGNHIHLLNENRASLQLVLAFKRNEETPSGKTLVLSS